MLSTRGFINFCGRTFPAGEINLMRQVAADCAALGTTEIARTVCELPDWKRPTGQLKNHECRQLLERLAAEGRLQLPPIREVGPRSPRRIAWTQENDPEPVIGRLTRLISAKPQDAVAWAESIYLTTG